jgi:hypothetical protein
MRAKLVLVVLVCLLLVPPVAAFAAPPSPDQLFGAEPAEPAIPALPAAELRALGPNSPDATLKWYTVAGAGFIPYSNGLNWGYGGSGCLAPNASGFWRANINLPDGAVMQSVYFGFHNALASTASAAFIYRYNYLGSAVIVVQLNSIPGSSGTGYKYTAAAITAPGVTIVNLTNAYMFAWSGSASQQLCYIQVGYVPAPTFGNFLPSLRRNSAGQ